MKLAGGVGPRRHVPVSIRGDLPSTSFIAALAYELQHVSELVASPELRDVAVLELLYRRICREYRRAGRRAFETDAALRSGAAVWREANRSTP